jgi:hypothetical protein
MVLKLVKEESMSRCQALSSFSTTWRWPAKMVASRNMASLRALLVTLKCFSRLMPHFCLAVSLMRRQCRPDAMAARRDLLL